MGKGWIKNFTSGGQVFLHSFRMFRQVVKRIAFFFLLWLCVFNSIWLMKHTSSYQRYLFVQWTVAKFQIDLGMVGARLWVRQFNGELIHILSKQLLNRGDIQEIVNHVRGILWNGFRLSVGSDLVCIMLIIFLLNQKGRRQRLNKHLRGTQVSDPHVLTKRLEKLKMASDYKLAGVPLIKDSETGHILISGAPGTGKTVCMFELLDQIRQNGQRVIIYDKMGVYLSHYFREGKDVLLNPLDVRSKPWSIWAECSRATEFDTMAASLIPHPQHGQDPFWINAARTIFSVVASRLQSQSAPHLPKTQTLLRYLLTSDLEQLIDLVAGSEAETLASFKVEKMAISVKATLANYLKSLKYIEESDHPFSIRKWVSDDQNDGWLFITSRADQHETLKPLISAWLDTAANALMSLCTDPKRRIWMLLDELPSLHRLPSLPSTLAESRQFGGCMVLSIQTIAQLREIYGQYAAEAISGLCNTRLSFRTPDPNTAKWVSDSLGKNELDSLRESLSYGANDVRDGVSVNHQYQIRPLVMESEILSLPNLSAYLSLPGDWPATKLQFTYREREQVVDTYVPRDIQIDSFGTAAPTKKSPDDKPSAGSGRSEPVIEPKSLDNEPLPL